MVANIRTFRTFITFISFKCVMYISVVEKLMMKNKISKKYFGGIIVDYRLKHI